MSSATVVVLSEFLWNFTVPMLTLWIFFQKEHTISKTDSEYIQKWSLYYKSISCPDTDFITGHIKFSALPKLSSYETCTRSVALLLLTKLNTLKLIGACQASSGSSWSGLLNLWISVWSQVWLHIWIFIYVFVHTYIFIVLPWWISLSLLLSICRCY